MPSPYSAGFHGIIEQMKRILIGILFLTIGVISLAATIRGGVLIGSAYAGSGEESVDLSAGVWRDGKAVFSDWTWLDFTMKDYLVRGYAPEQPIKYSHKLHVEQLGIECQYCHSGVAKSPYASLPAVDTCMGCHKHVKTESPEIKKLAKHFNDKTPIEWEPVNNLPDHVYFNHQRHVKAGVGCQNCHGQVQKMDVVEKVSSLKMGFCVSCHRENGASIDCGICHY